GLSMSWSLCYSPLELSLVMTRDLVTWRRSSGCRLSHCLVHNYQNGSCRSTRRPSGWEASHVPINPVGIPGGSPPQSACGTWMKSWFGRKWSSLWPSTLRSPVELCELRYHRHTTNLTLH